MRKHLAIFTISVFSVAALATLPGILTPGGEGLLGASPVVADFSEIKIGDRIQVELLKGGKLEGEVIARDGISIQLKHKFGVARIRSDEVASWEKFRTISEQFEERAKKCKKADEWCDLGEWAEAQREPDLAETAYRDALKVDPEHLRAHEALGEVKHEGSWMPLAEAMAKQGKELYDGEWLTPEEIAEREEARAGRVREQKLKGRNEYLRELEGRPWAEVEPIETEHYIVMCNSTEEVAKRYSEVMEALYKAYDKVFIEKNFPRKYRKFRRSEVYIHANHQQFMDWTGNGPGTGGFYMLTRQDVTAYHGAFGTTGSTEEVLAHEGTHQFEGMIFKDLRFLPIWFIEGLAVYFGDGSKIGRRKVEINEIPRDRLVGLKQAIEDGTYCNLSKLLRIPQQAFGGFFYGHAWGVLYWCLYGNEMGNGAGKQGEEIITDWILHCQTLDSFCDYEKEARYFENLITQVTGKQVEEWEAEYKEWILSLPVESLGRRRGNSWSSEKLKVEVEKPIGWRWVSDGKLVRDEIVAAIGNGSNHRRISTYAWPNWQHAEMTKEYVSSTIGNIFSEIEFIDEPTAQEIGGYPAYLTTFTGRKAIGQIANEEGKAETEFGPEMKYQVVVYGSVDKIYANVFETTPELYEEHLSHFLKFLENFKITS